MKRRLFSFLIALAMLGITAGVFCYQAEVVNISGNKYFPAVKEALAKAKESICLVMFTIELSTEKQNSKANQLINTIIEAKNCIYIHGTSQEKLIGKPASHGCIRMKNRDIIELFNRVKRNTLVEIAK